MKKKLKEVFLTMASFGILIYLGHHTYLLEWLAKRWFCFLWVPILILWIFRQEFLARWLTLGAFGGLFLGQLAEDIKWEIYGLDNMAAHSSYWGVGIWFAAVAATLLLGIIHLSLKRRKAAREAEKAAMAAIAEKRARKAREESQNT